jgi:hypothetical protein
MTAMGKLGVLVVLGALLSMSLPAGAPVQASSTIDITLRETILLPSSPTSILRVNAVQDMDGDGNLDLVIFDHDIGRMSILERSGSSFVTRFGFSTNEYFTGTGVADIDGDGIPEIGMKTSFSGGRFYVFESTGDDTYAQIHFQYLGSYPELVRVGDSDDDGNLEFLVPRETFPSNVHRFEAIADDTYVQLPILTGRGGDCYLAGVMDLDGDGDSETVFSDNDYRSSGYKYRGYLYVYENDVLVYEDPLNLMLSWSLGDTDGNGLGEIIGRDKEWSSRGVPTDKMRILESTGVGNDFVEVFYDTALYTYNVIDADADGQSEFWRRIDSGIGQLDTFALAHRSGSTITDFYDSGTMLQSFSGDIISLSPIDDTNGDGRSELAVLQGTNLHILEVSSGCTIDSLRDGVLAAGLRRGTERSLLAKIYAALRSYHRGRDYTGNNQLGAFINEVKAQRGKKIPSDTADDLIANADCIISEH